MIIFNSRPIPCPLFIKFNFSKAPLKNLKFEFIEYKNVQHEAHQEVITYTDATQQIEYLLNKNRGLIVLTIHLGCFEVLAQMYAQYVNVTALYKPPRQKELDTPAYTMTLIQNLQLHTNAMLVFECAERLPRAAGYKIHSIVLEKPLPNDALAAATIINQNIESLIRKVPHQYMWGYNRYKHPTGSPLPPTIESVTAKKYQHERNEIARQVFRTVIRSYAERAIFWAGSAKHLKKIIQIDDQCNLASFAGRPHIVVGLHLAGMEGGAIRMTQYLTELGCQPELLRIIKRWQLMHLLPDMDFGKRDSIFVPFFGVPACTLTSLARLSKITHAAVIPLVCEMLPNYQGYILRFLPP
ncbi:hypothetical protein ACTFIZ_008611 [Dictyostelium cf. discoideum]